MSDTFSREMDIAEHFRNCPQTYIDESDFTVWLSAHDGEIIKATEGRIIALLETRLDDCYEKNDMGGWSFSPTLFIALIKGENK